MWDSPYQASRFFTDSTGAPAPAGADLAAALITAESAMSRSQICFLDLLVTGDVGVVAFGEHRATRQHGDDVGKVGDDAQIMFDHQDGVFRGDALDQCCDLVDVF